MARVICSASGFSSAGRTSEAAVESILKGAERNCYVPNATPRINGTQLNLSQKGLDRIRFGATIIRGRQVVAV